MRVVVVGAGTTGAMACGLIASLRPDWDVVNVRSKDIPIVGVGESTTPIFVKALRDMGLIQKFIDNRLCWPKYGVKFVDWHDKQFYGGWAINNFEEETITYLYGLTKGERIGRLDQRIDEGLVPYDKDNNKFFSVIGLHIDANETSKFIFEEFKDKITTVYGTVVGLVRNEEKLLTINVDGQVIEADLWIDCTGFSRKLISTFMPEFVPSNLPVNAAAFIPIVPNKKDMDFWTTARAGNAGWMWNIPFENRSGTGYVYNKDFLDKNEAAEELANFANQDSAQVGHFEFTGGWLKEPWTSNIVSMGLAAGFLDALDASSLHVTVRQVYNFLGNNREKYNELTTYDFQRLLDYISIYYKTCKIDSEFWNSIEQIKEEELVQMFKDAFLREGWNSYDLSGFTNSITARIITNRVDISKDVAYEILKTIPFEETKFAIDKYNKVKDKYVPFTYDLFKSHVMDMSQAWDNR
jgi:tryptophan halogenase